MPWTEYKEGSSVMLGGVSLAVYKSCGKWYAHHDNEHDPLLLKGAETLEQAKRQALGMLISKIKPVMDAAISELLESEA